MQKELNTNELKGFKYRDPLALIYAILKIINSTRNLSTWKIANYALTTHKKINHILVDLKHKGIVELDENGKWIITEKKGMKVLEILQNMKDIIDCKGNLFFFVNPLDEYPLARSKNNNDST